MSEQLELDANQLVSITTTPLKLRALLGIVRRMPVSDLEACAIEDMFGGWFREMQAQQALAAMAQAGLSRSTADDTPQGPPAAARPGDVLDGATDQPGPPDAPDAPGAPLSTRQP